MNYDIHIFPPDPSVDLETLDVLRQLAHSYRALAELKGAVLAIPNAGILIDTLPIQEARDSSTIENIVTTQDEVYRTAAFEGEFSGAAAKEVVRYTQALRTGFDLLRRNGILRTADILKIHEELLGVRSEYRRVPGTVLKNAVTGKTVYTPPQDGQVVESLMANFLTCFHGARQWKVDPLVQMTVLHHQFESIHPFTDGNGRTGRILNLLYLVHHDMLDVPVLYLSRAIVQNKERYYSLLQHVRDTGEWEPWILYMLRAVETTAQETLLKVRRICALHAEVSQRIRNEHPRMYQPELVRHLFAYPYTKIDHVMRACDVSRPTAAKYLSALEAMDILHMTKAHRTNLYLHTELFDILST
jgi:Fic family protein